MAAATENKIIDTIEYDVTLGEKKLLTKNGDRKPVNFINKINFAEGYYFDKAVLTLLKIESDLYSLSIKVDKPKVFNLNSLNFINNRLYSSKTKTYKDLNQNQNINLSHVLFIGNVEQTNGNFIIKKTILIIIDDGIGEAEQHNDIGGEEEYLNLHHIDYFSFMYDDFKKMYDEYKVKNERQQNPDSRKKINNAATAATAVLATTKLRKPIRPLPKVQPAAAAAARKEEEPREEDEDEDEDKEEDEDKDKEEDEDKDKDKATASRDQAAADGARDEAAGAARKEEKAPRDEDEDEDKDKDKATAARDQSAADGARDEAALQVEQAAAARKEEKAALQVKPAALQVKPAAPVVEQVAQEPTQQPTGEIQEGEMGGGKKKLRKPKPKKPKKSK